MKLIAKGHYKRFHFKTPGGTSRGILTDKHSWFIEICTFNNPETTGTGECSIIPGLSPEYVSHDQYEKLVKRAVNFINGNEGKNLDEILEKIKLEFRSYPSILFGLETAIYDLKNGGTRTIFINAFSRGKKSIPINGLIWMGAEHFMQQQIEEKLNSGFKTIKMKIGAIDFDSELKLLTKIRKQYSSEEITLRVDANGAFTIEEARNVLNKLAELNIHSIEQPIKAGQWVQMKALCSNAKTPIALDEELIGINDLIEKEKLLDTITPQFIILKPSLHGGISGTKEWIELAKKRKIDWWMTSALESNIGLNAICQLVGEYDTNLPQGLGTGSLYTDNIASKLEVNNGTISLNLAND